MTSCEVVIIFDIGIFLSLILSTIVQDLGTTFRALLLQLTSLIVIGTYSEFE